MTKRAITTLLAAAAISLPVLAAPALFSPAAAQASMNLSLSLPGPEPVYGGGYVVGGPAYAWGEGWHRGWDRHEWREHRWGHGWDRGHHWGRDWGRDNWGHRWN